MFSNQPSYMIQKIFEDEEFKVDPELFKEFLETKDDDDSERIKLTLENANVYDIRISNGKESLIQIIY